MSLQTRTRCFGKWNPINYFLLDYQAPSWNWKKKKMHQDITHGAKAIFSRDYRPPYFLKGATCNVVLQAGPTVKALIKAEGARLPASGWAHRHQAVPHTYQHVLSVHRTASWDRTGILARFVTPSSALQTHHEVIKSLLNWPLWSEGISSPLCRMKKKKKIYFQWFEQHAKRFKMPKEQNKQAGINQ